MRDSFYAKLGFYLSLGFWIPLFNVAICITSMVFAVLAIRRHSHDPKHYGGMVYAAIAMVLSLTSLVLTVVGILIWLFSENICSSQICQVYNATR